MVRLTHLCLPLQLLALLAFLPLTARADVNFPMIEVGGGLEAVPSQPVHVLLRLNVEGVTVGLAGNKWVSSYVLARVNGNLAMSTLASGRGVSFMDIEFVPVDLRTGDGLGGVEFRALPMRFGTNVRLNQGATIRVDLAGVQTSFLGPSGFSERVLIFAKVAADALGYKMATRLSTPNPNQANQGDFRGANVAALGGETGIVSVIGDSLKVRIAFGGTADLNLGGNVGTGFALESDLSAYNEVSLDIKNFFRLFIRNRLNARINGGMETTSEYQLLGGATFIF